MRVIIINQAFYPDVVSSGQHLADLASRLVERGHEVTVITSRRAYDDPGKIFSKRENWKGVRIFRVFATGFGKRAKWRRAADFATFLGSCCWRLFWLPRQDVLMTLTSPPIVSFVGAFFARLKGSKFCYWIMDLNPDEALAAGWLKPGSLAARMLERCSRFSLRSAEKIVVLDHFMQQRILAKQIDSHKILVIPPWSHDSEVGYDAAGRLRFRKQLGLEDKFVVMYAGNHSPCHPLDTVLAAARQLAENPAIAFLFVGGGSQFAKVKSFARDNALKNVICLPYQPIHELAGALSAADLHLVVMGDPFVGLVHPCKIYNILKVGSPLLYIGPRPSHISEILEQIQGRLPSASAGHGQPETVVQHILRLQETAAQRHHDAFASVADRFSKAVLMPRLVATLEAAVEI